MSPATFRSLALVIALCTACTSWKPVNSPAEAAGSPKVRVVANNGDSMILDDPTEREIANAFRWARRIEVPEEDKAATIGLIVVGSVCGVLALAGAYVLLTLGTLGARH